MVNGSGWACADDNDTNTDILSDLKCASSQMAVTGNDGEWICSDPEVTDAEDIISAIEAMICGEGEELTRNDTGEIICFNDDLACPYTQQIEDFYDTHRNSVIFTSNYIYKSTGITDNEDVCSVSDEYIISGLGELIYTSIIIGDYSMYGLGIDPVEDGVLSLIFNEDFNLFDPEYSVEHFSTTDEAVACAVLLGCENFGQQEN